MDQAELLQDLVSTFKLNTTSKNKSDINRLSPEVLDMIESMIKNNKEVDKDNHTLADEKPSIILSDNEFGKC
ncbi:hypothetical protein [Tepidimicrobium xylanilyticum]|uniref:hypothetical protein n=1 Tax=Tepidimicrobium xylanilyticum TaxID=1123352 RepID=UPI00264D1C8C|nr:hypothetical protein [Tepidimicrobium xylanilyticum]GMG96549.1 hypothetical protein EN5CB1_13750 [Tepidimicrobium xylanilyticum]